MSSLAKRSLVEPSLAHMIVKDENDPLFHLECYYNRARTMKITSVKAEPIAGEINPDIAIISSLGKHIAGQYVLVRLTDDDGNFGLGEASVTSVWSGETQTGTIAIIEDVFSPLLKDADPFDLEYLSTKMRKIAFGNSFARAAVEMALLDLQGKRLAHRSTISWAAKIPRLKRESGSSSSSVPWKPISPHSGRSA